jgi:hypothetical protein
MTEEDEGQETEGREAPPAPPLVILTGEAGFEPKFPVVGTPIEYYWDEINVGGKHTEDVYNARVVFKNDDQVIDDISVECTPLDTNEAAHRTTTLSAPSARGIGYSIELWVDIDHNAQSTTTNYAYHSVTVDDA